MTISTPLWTIRNTHKNKSVFSLQLFQHIFTDFNPVFLVWLLNISSASDMLVLMFLSKPEYCFTSFMVPMEPQLLSLAAG